MRLPRGSTNAVTKDCPSNEVKEAFDVTVRLAAPLADCLCGRVDRVECRGIARQHRHDLVLDVFFELGHFETVRRAKDGEKLVTQSVLPPSGPDDMVKALRAAMDALCFSAGSGTKAERKRTFGGWMRTAPIRSSSRAESKISGSNVRPTRSGLTT